MSPSSPTLYLVSTPIGNLKDLSRRARQVLNEVRLVIAEDTRRTQNLLSHLGRTVSLESFHENSSRKKLQRIIDTMQEQKSTAYLSDAGNPVIQDPARRLVAEARQNAIEVQPIPGPSAVTTALSVCGFDVNSFTFAGYPPRNNKKRKAWLETYFNQSDLVVLFESPHRLEETLETIASIRKTLPTVICRELTKQHEEIMKDRASSLLQKIQARELQGEFTLVLQTTELQEDPEFQTMSFAPDLQKSIKLLNSEDLPTSRAARILAHFTELNRSDAYQKLLDHQENKT